MGLLSRLFGGSPRPPRLSVSDPVLGAVVPGGDVDWWTATVVIDGNPIEFDIGGDTEPHPALLARARELARDFEPFAREVRDLLEAKALECSDLPPEVAAEFRSLRIQSVSHFRPERPRDGMVGFHETESGVVLWRCDVKDGHPINLGGDT